MLAHKLTLADGTVLDSGTIRSVQLTEQVSDQEDLSPGAACAACAEIELWAPENGLSIAQGTRMTLARIDTDTGTETQAGIFLAEKPEKVSANVIRVTAYDCMTLLDQNLSPWLREQQGSFPMALADFVRAVCARCGVTLADGTLDGLPSGEYPVQAFYADNLTGRQLIQWAAQAACRFARMTPEGTLEFAWYKTSASTGIGPGNLRLPTQVVLAGDVLYTANDEVWLFGTQQAGYLSGSLSYEDYETAPIDKVQIRQSDDDVGVLYPPEETGTNALVLQGNLLLTTASADDLRPVAQAIYETMQGVCYTPLSVSVQASGTLPQTGEILSITDTYGCTLTAYIMKRTISGQKCTLECTGNARRNSTAAVNEQSFSNLKGRVLEISANVDGLRITARDLQGSFAELELTVDGLGSQVEKQYTNLTNYVDQQTGQIKDDAIKEAVQQASDLLDSTLTFYPTTAEMQSAINQSASNISLQVSQKLTGYSTTGAMQDYVDGQTSGALHDAKDYTDGQLQYYPTTVEMQSAIQQSASDINLQVNSKLTMYPTTGDMQDYVDGQTANLPTTSTVQNLIDIGIQGITLSATTNGTSSTITLRNNGVQISSAKINFSGLVTFSDLSGSGMSVINGDNITTGVIRSGSGNTEYNLDNGYIRSGPSSGTRFEINSNRINWYVDNYLTGVLYSVYGTSYLGANSQYTIYGWVDSGTPSSWHGMQVDNNASQCLFNTNHVDVQHDLGVSGTVSTRDLSAWGSKNRIVHTPLGNLAFAAMESPEPAFCDWGGGTVGEDGTCPIHFSQQYAVSIAHQRVRWLITPVEGAASLWLERTDYGALVHGQPGDKFDWFCLGVQFDMVGIYADCSSVKPPPEVDETALVAKSASIAAEINEQKNMEAQYEYDQDYYHDQCAADC